MLKKKLKKFLSFLIAIILACGIFYGGFLFGQNQPSTLNKIIPAGSINLIAETPPTNVDFSLLWEGWKLVDKNYIQTADKEKRVEGAVKGMVSSLDDPYSVYLSPSTNKRFTQDLEGQFDGIGAEIGIKYEMLTIISPLADSPAEKAGIKAKDIIVKIDGKETEKMAFDEAIMKIRGKKGTTVTLTIIHDGDGKEVDIKIIRDVINLKSIEVSFSQEKPEIAILKINQFGDDTTRLVEKFLREVKDKKSTALIVDLRNNPGGYLESAVDLVSLFIPNDLSSLEKQPLKDGVVVVEVGKYSRHQSQRTKKQLCDLPLIVIQNKGSASASEIFAGAIKDYSRGKVIGETSFGKGSVQTLQNLSNRGAIKITTAKWLTPLGTTIDGKGISPDVSINEEETENKDQYLQKAIEILSSAS